MRVIWFADSDALSEWQAPATRWRGWASFFARLSDFKTLEPLLLQQTSHARHYRKDAAFNLRQRISSLAKIEAATPLQQEDSGKTIAGEQKLHEILEYFIRRCDFTGLRHCLLEIGKPLRCEPGHPQQRLHNLCKLSSWNRRS